MALHLVEPAGRVGERQLPHPGRAPAQPEDLTEFLLPFSRSGTAIPMCQMLPMMSSYPDDASASTVTISGRSVHLSARLIP